MAERYFQISVKSFLTLSSTYRIFYRKVIDKLKLFSTDQSGDVPGWVLVVLMTTGLVTAIWTIAQPRISSILRNSLDNMNNIR